MSNTIDISKINDDELIEEFKKRFIVLQYHDKDTIEMLVDKEISTEKYERFKVRLENKDYVYCKIDDIILEAWNDFNEYE